MARKIKHAKLQAIPLQAREGAVLAAQAEAALAGLHHKEAIELYKELLKRERRPAWIDGLAACYAGRAHDLAAKGMFKEALISWRNRTQLCGKPLAEGPYLAWLLKAGEQGEVFRLLHDKSLPAKTLAELDTCLAALVLTAPDNALPALPAESALLRHRPLAQAALAAYDRGDFTELMQLLQTIPFRSPYRDLKPVLKALALLQTDAAAAPAAIARLPADGPFERLVALLRSAVLPDAQWLAALRNLDENGRQLLFDLKGCSAALRPLLLDLTKPGAAVPAALFDLLVRHRRALPEGSAADLCCHLLPHASSRMKQYDETFGKLTEEERQHILALAAEQEGVPERAVEHWVRMAKMLSASAMPRPKQRAALIWRHLANPQYASPASRLDYLKRSIELDPEQRDTQLSLIEALRTAGDLPQARIALNQALLHFPKDVALLLEAIEIALAGKAFKKAVGLAKQVLELDPINQKVRALTGHALLSHARKQIKARNYAAAHKELDAALEWLKMPSEHATLKLLRALAASHASDASDTQVREAVAELGGSVAGGFHLLLEAGRIGLDPKGLLARGGIVLAPTPSTEVVVSLAHALNKVAADGESKLVRAALAPLHGPLKRAATGPFSEADQRLACEAFQRHGETGLLRTYAAAALERWPQRPLFVYFAVAADHGDNPEQIPRRERLALETALNAAKSEGDRRTVQRIISLLDPLDDARSFSDGIPFGAMPDNPRALLEMMLDIAGERDFLDFVKESIGKQAFIDLKQQSHGDKQEFMHSLIDLMASQSQPLKRPSPNP